MELVELVFNGRDNEIVLELLEDSRPIQMDGVTRILIELIGSPASVDSNDAPSAIRWGETPGELRLRLGGQELPAGRHVVRVTLFDPNNPAGRAVIHEHSDRKLRLLVKD